MTYPAVVEDIFKKHAEAGAYARVDQIGPDSDIINYHYTLEGEFSHDQFKKFISEAHQALGLSQNDVLIKALKDIRKESHWSNVHQIIDDALKA